MTDKLNIKLTGIPETLLISARARYLESKMPDGIIHDRKTIEILDAIDCDFSGQREVSKSSQWGTSVRTEIIDELTLAFMAKQPDGVVVNLGCGLDTRFYRLDNGRVRWFDLDVAETIEVRRHFFEENERYRFIVKSALDFTWIDAVPTDSPTLIIAEGLFMYFTEEEVKSVLSHCAKAFGQLDFVLEAMAPFSIKHEDKHPDVKKYDASFKWGIKSGREIADWGVGMGFVAEYFYFDRHRDKLSWWMRLVSALSPSFRRMMKIIHLKRIDA